LKKKLMKQLYELREEIDNGWNATFFKTHKLLILQLFYQGQFLQEVF